MKTILFNGKIYVEKGIFKEALLIEDGIIQQIGSNEEILKNTGDQVVDLQQKTVIPGLNDSHLHLMSIGEAMSSCELNGATSIDDIIALGKAFLERNPNLEVLKGRGWNQDFFTTGEKRLLNRFDLDQISTDIPLVFERVCGHVAVGNTKALEMLHVDANTTVDGGVIELGRDGTPNGVFNENAVKLLLSILPPKDEDYIETQILKAADYALSVGITSVQSCDIMSNEYEKIVDVIHQISKSRKLKLRYSHQFNFQDIQYFKNILKQNTKQESTMKTFFQEVL